MCKKRKYDYLILLVIAILYQLVFSASVYLNYFSGDSKVFQVMGLSILKGGVPYIDLFDHKGIVLYWIDAIGLGILPHGYGLLLLCIISQSIAAHFWLRASSLFIYDWRRWVPVLIGFVICAVLQGDGNLTEMWSLLPISYAVYLFARNIKTKELNRLYEFILLGVGMGFIVFIRPNNIIPIAWYCVIYVLYSLYRKDFKRVTISSFLIFAGVFVSIGGICLAYSLLYGSLYPLVYGTFIFNMKYAHIGAFHARSLLAPYLLLITTLFVLLLSCLFIRKSAKDYLGKEERWIVLAFITGAFLLTVYTMSGAYFNHYFVVLVPTLVLAAIIPANLVGKKSMLIGIMLVGGVASIGIIAAYKIVPAIKMKVREKLSYSQNVKSLDDFIAAIPEGEKNDIWNYSGKFLCINTLFHNGIIQKNRIILPFQLNVDEELHEIGTIQEMHPKWLVASKSNPWLNPQDSLFVIENYTKRFSSEVLREYDIDIFQHN